MNERNGRDLDAEEIEGIVGLAERDAGNGAEFGLAVEDVSEGASDGVVSFAVGENGERDLLAEIIGTNIVEAHDVIGVAVSEKNGVETIEADAESLLSKIGSGVDDGIFSCASEK